nr:MULTISPECIES: helix-turn-helix transcriptional regulator [Devosia]
MASLAHRARQLRLSKNLTQEGLATRAGVSLGTLKLFERTGKAGFETVVKIAYALEAEREFEALFPPSQITRIEDVVEKAPRKRGRRK